MEIRLAKESDCQRWNNFVKNHDRGWMYHLFEWGDIFSKIYGHKPIYLLAEQDRNIVGVFPIILIDSFLFGRVLVSMPYFCFGGMLSYSEKIDEGLLERASEIGMQYQAKYIEMRQVDAAKTSLPYRSNKTLMILDLAKTPEEQIGRFKPRLRNQVRNAIKNKANFTIRLGRDFKPLFKVYSENMRYLGSPHHSEELFKAILDTFPKNSLTATVFKDEIPIASAIALMYKGIVEIPCVSSLRAWNKHLANIKLYWHLIEYACDEGFNKFSFGRSSIDSGTYIFKKRWGAIAHKLPYSYLCITSDSKTCVDGQNRGNGIGRRVAIHIWRKMPLSLTRRIGPKVLRHLPPVI